MLPSRRQSIVCHFVLVVRFSPVRVVRVIETKVVKLLRAHGGCLGVGRRRRAWKAAKSLGEPSNRR